ncbi:hypothetical protein NDU88_002177 [Pleurodeles waltl]|uniref:Uncharacterized protein n=1 Tax=Pleurodeles waltl TaxID=8319 RepID=A0AAV7M7E6_PLEWA|nr:hypothetical protein NDU88_002177 [Pleurodeles waltl]
MGRSGAGAARAQQSSEVGLRARGLPTEVEEEEPRGCRATKAWRGPGRGKGHEEGGEQGPTCGRVHRSLERSGKGGGGVRRARRGLHSASSTQPELRESGARRLGPRPGRGWSLETREARRRRRELGAESRDLWSSSKAGGFRESARLPPRPFTKTNSDGLPGPVNIPKRRARVLQESATEHTGYEILRPAA